MWKRLTKYDRQVIEAYVLLTLCLVIVIAGVLWRPPLSFGHRIFDLRISHQENDPGSMEVVVTPKSAHFWVGWRGTLSSTVRLYHFPQARNALGNDWIPTSAAMPGGVLVFGSVFQRGNELRFKPAAPLIPKERYVAVFVHGTDDAGQTTKSGLDTHVMGAGRLMLGFTVPSAGGVLDAPFLQIHPTATALPANHLKFYLSFSQPMEQGVFMERIQLLRGDGSEARGAFRETELWSPDGKRLTVWLHPGRQKTGVNLNEDEGMVLQEGGQYTLKIDGRWRAANGAPLGKDQTKTFRAAAADHSPVDVNRWSFSHPRAGTRDPLMLTFPESLDWALLQNSIALQDARGQIVAGEIRIPDGEREWCFTPTTAWQAGEHRLAIDKRLEDLAGNNLERAFEIDVSAPPPLSTAATSYLPIPIDRAGGSQDRRQK